MNELSPVTISVYEIIKGNANKVLLITGPNESLIRIFTDLMTESAFAGYNLGIEHAAKTIEEFLSGQGPQGDSKEHQAEAEVSREATETRFEPDLAEALARSGSDLSEEQQNSDFLANTGNRPDDFSPRQEESEQPPLQRKA